MKAKEYIDRRSSTGLHHVRANNWNFKFGPVNGLRPLSELTRRVKEPKWAGIFALALIFVLAADKTEAQQPRKFWRIGFLSSVSPSPYTHLYTAFLEGLRDAGYVDGQNVVIKPRWGEGNTERLPHLAAELVDSKVELLVSAGGTITALAAKAATANIPIIFIAGDDLVKVGLISSLARPGANLTGLSLLTTELGVKRLELLKETFPKIRRVGVLGNPANPNYGIQVTETQAAASQLGLQLEALEARNPNQLEAVFSRISEKNISALLVLSDPMLNSHRERSADLATKSRVPAIFEFKEFAEAGALMSYGTNLVAVYRRIAIYVDKILKGAKPSELPVEQPTNFEFLINLKTAKQMGLTIPPNVLARADRVIR